MANDGRLVNLLGAAALGIADAIGADAARAAGLDQTAATALVALHDLARGGSIRAVSRLIGISHSGTVRLVDRMVDDGLITRAPGQDGRTLAVDLTRRGTSLARQLRAERAAAIAAALKGLTVEQRTHLTAICDVIVGNLASQRLSNRADGRPPVGGALCRLCDPLGCERRWSLPRRDRRHAYTGWAMTAPNEDDVPGREKSGAPVQSVDRALVVLEILGKLGAAGVTEIAAELGVHKSTVSRLVAVLESRGFVEQLSDRGKYRLGFAIVRLAGSTSAQMDLAKESQAVCDRLAQQSGETTNVAVLDGGRIINVVESLGPGEVSLRSWVGQSCPAHATSSGKVLLAALPPDDVLERLGDPLPTFTPKTVADAGVLRAELDRARRVGWASVSEELEVGLHAVAAPIRDATGKVVAALSISGPSYRMASDRFDELAVMAVAAAEEISRRLGHIG